MRIKAMGWWTPSYARALAAAFIGITGHWIVLTILQWHVATLPGSTASDLGMLYFMGLIPLLFFAPLIGPVTDRSSRKGIIIASVAGVGATAVCGASLLMAGNLTLAGALFLAGMLGLMMSLNAPTSQAFIPEQVSRGDMGRAITLYAAGQNVARTLGPMAGGVLIVAVTLPGTLWLVGIGCVLASALVIPIVERRKGEPGGQSLVAAVLSGFAIVTTTPLIRRAIILVAITGSVGLSYASMLPVIAADILREGQLGFSLLLAGSGIGSVVGALLPYPRVSKPIHISYLLAPMAVAMLVLALATNLVVACGACLILSGAGVAVMTKLNIMVQNNVSDSVRGRVMGIYSWAWGGSMPIGGLLLGHAVDGLTFRIGLLGACVLLGITAAVNWLLAGQTGTGPGSRT